MDVGPGAGRACGNWCKEDALVEKVSLLCVWREATALLALPSVVVNMFSVRHRYLSPRLHARALIASETLENEFSISYKSTPPYLSPPLAFFLSSRGTLHSLILRAAVMYFNYLQATQHLRQARRASEKRERDVPRLPLF